MAGGTDQAQPTWWLLLVVAAVLISGFVLLREFPRRNAAGTAPLELSSPASSSRSVWRQYSPAGLTALIVVAIGLAGPTAIAQVPRSDATIILAVDVSWSMEATDVAPTRLAAAQAASTWFADQLPESVHLGLVSYAYRAQVLVPPTTDRTVFKHAVDSIQLAPSTATGEGIFAALGLIEPATSTNPTDAHPSPHPHIVLMADGAQTIPRGPDGENEPRGAFTAARAAATADVPVSTIALGTKNGTISLYQKPQSVPIDDSAMRVIGQIAGGQSFVADSEQQLRDVYTTLRDQVGFEFKRVDARLSWFAVGALATMVSIGCCALASARRGP